MTEIQTQKLTLDDVVGFAAKALTNQKFIADKVELIGLALKDAATASNISNQSGLEAALTRLQEAILDPQVVAVRDQFFKAAKISITGEVFWELKDGVVAKDAVSAMDEVNRKVHRKALWPSDYAASFAEGYNSTEGARAGQAVLGVPKSRGKNLEKMERLKDTPLASRYVSIVSLNVSLLITGKHPLEGEMELRDASGILSAGDNRLHACTHEGTRDMAHRKLAALGCRNPCPAL